MTGRVMRWAAVARWSARVLSAGVVLFWGFFLIAHMFGDAGRPSRPPTWADYVIVAALVWSLVGLVLAWRWEARGALITLAGVGAAAAMNWKMLIFPGTLIPVTAALFLASWRLDRARGSGAALRRVG